ncbi:MAG: SMI1/KNR4 family protein [Polyangia bacterium]|jgi:hypothetical protein
MNDFQRLIKQLEQDYAKHGQKLVASVGTHLYGSTPHKGKDSWHHELFRPLNEDEIKKLQDEVGHIFPESLKELYRATNGLALFSDELAIYGLRDILGRSGDSVWQPYSLVEPNTLERPRDASKDDIFIGGYSFDGSLVKLSGRSGVVEACKRDRAKDTFARWPDLPTFLHQEYARLKTHFNEKLELRDPDASTLPG